MKKSVLLLLLVSAQSLIVTAQMSADKVVGKKNKELADSIKAQDYPYILPIWGAKVTKKGFELPYSAGIGLNYLDQQSDIIIDNLSVGFNNGPKYELDEIIRFNKAISRASGVNVRPDVWLFPFLNVYAILAKAKTSTEIGAGLWVPNGSDSWKEVGSFTTKANFEATSVGFGVTPTMGVGGGWAALDMNFVWTDVSALDKPVYSFIFGPRFGKTFRFKKPQRNVAIWVGGFRLMLESKTNGNLPLSEVVDTEQFNLKIDNANANINQSQIEVDAWWNSLTAIEQKQPSNQAKYETANRALTKAGEIVGAADAAGARVESSTVQYTLDKRPKDMWNFVVGTQFQYNKHWMIRFEYGFLGSRQQIITGLQYRFGL